MQTSSYDLAQFLITLAGLLPFLLVHCIGALLSLVFRKRMGKAWIFSLLGFVLFILVSVWDIGLQVWIQLLRDRSDFGNMTVVLRMSWVVHLVFSLLGMILILVAMFVGRGSAEVKVDKI